METSTTILCVVAILALVMVIALFKKSSVKASGKIGPGSFTIEASDK